MNNDSKIRYLIFQSPKYYNIVYRQLWFNLYARNNCELFVMTTEMSMSCYIRKLKEFKTMFG